MTENLQKAYEMEAEMIMSMMENLEESGDLESSEESRETQEYRIRNMMLAREYMEREIREMKQMRDLIKTNWDTKIKNKEEQVENIKEYIFNWVEKENDGKTYRNDVGTLSLRKPSARVSIRKDSEEEIIAALESANMLEEYLKEPELDKKKYLDEIKEGIKSKAKENAEAKYKEIEEETGKSLTKTKMKEILKEEEDLIYKSLMNNENSFVDVKYTDPALSIRSSVKF